MKCTGPNWNQCVGPTCASGHTLSGTECRLDCTGATYWRASDNTCQPCHGDCSTCSGPAANECLSCSDSAKILASHPAAGPCTACASNQFKSDVKTCFNCHGDCSTCDGAAASNCLSCTDSVKIIASHPTSGACTGCPANQHKASVSTCSNCHADCATCSGGNNNECITCVAMKVNPSSPTPGSCTTCSSSQFKASETTCSACDGSCLTCSGGAANQCLSCSDGKYLDGSNQC